jgi:putative N-acetylmannosamine-6-phosphate epimerase
MGQFKSETIIPVIGIREDKFSYVTITEFLRDLKILSEAGCQWLTFNPSYLGG